MNAFVQLLKDNEAEVRTAGAGQVPGMFVKYGILRCLLNRYWAGFAKLIDRETILARILPCVRDLSQDASQHVRASLANQISGLAPLLGKDATTGHLLNLFLHLLKDEFPEVRLNVISKLELVNSGDYLDRLPET